MCEVCDEIREECWTEVRDLLNYNRAEELRGPFSKALAESLKECVANDPEWAAMDEDEIQRRVEAVRANLIADRCARIAQRCPGADTHMQPMSGIMYGWAKDLLHAEMRSKTQGMTLGDFLSGFLGGEIVGGFVIPISPDDEDDEDA